MQTFCKLFFLEILTGKAIFATMKRHFLFFAALVLCVSACTHHRYPRQLVVADSLCSVNPDSAIRLLSQLADTMQTAGKPDLMYHQLLSIKAADKANQLKPDADKILSIVDYYEHRGDKALLPTAYYYAGRTYSEAQDAPQALSYFQKAAEVNDKDWSLQSKIFSQMGYLFLYQGLYSEMTEAHEKAYEYAKHSKDTLDMIHCLRDMAIAVESQDKHSEALNYLNEASRLAKAVKDSFLIMNLELNMAHQYRFMYQLDEAKKHAFEVIPNIHMVDSSVVYYTIATIYKRTLQEDSTIFYSKRAEKGSWVYAKDSIYKFLTDIYLNQSNTKEAKRYFSLFLQYEDSLKKITNTEALKRVQALYNYQLREKENIELEKEIRNKKVHFLFFAISSSVVILILLIVWWFYRRHQHELLLRYQRAIQLRNESLRKSAIQIDQNNMRIAELEHEINQLNYDSSELRKELEHERKKLQNTNTIAAIKIKEQDAAFDFITHSPVCQQLFRMSEDKDAPNPTYKDWCTLEQLLNQEYNMFTQKLKSLCRLSELEYHICMLVKIKLEPSRISRLLKTSKSNVTTTRSRLYKKVFGTKGTSEQWDQFIWSL